MHDTFVCTAHTNRNHDRAGALQSQLGSRHGNEARMTRQRLMLAGPGSLASLSQQACHVLAFTSTCFCFHC